jgi:hypothetical protein
MQPITDELIHEIKDRVVNGGHPLFKKDNKPQRTQSSKKKIFANSALSAVRKSAFIRVHLRLNELKFIYVFITARIWAGIINQKLSLERITQINIDSLT